MNKILIAILAVFALALTAGTVMAIPTGVTGYVYYPNASGVEGANVDVTCEHLGVNSTEFSVSASDGGYFVIFSEDDCGYTDMVWVHADKDGMEGTNDGTIGLCEEDGCPINVGLVDVTIPEFGVIAATLGVVGALGIVMYRRRQ